MSADKTPPPMRSITIRMKARKKGDLAAALTAVVAAVPAAVEVELCGVDDSPPLAPSPQDDVLATKARELAQAVLGEKQAEVDRNTAAAERDADRLRAEVVASRAGFRAFALHWAGQGVRITVQLYERSVGAIAGAVSRMLGGSGGKGE